MFGMFFCFCYVIWTAILVVVRPALLKEGGLKESYGELSIFFFFFFSFFAKMECLSSFLARENHWPSLFFFFCFSTQTRALVRGVLCSQHMLLGVSAHQSSQLFI